MTKINPLVFTTDSLYMQAEKQNNKDYSESLFNSAPSQEIGLDGDFKKLLDARREQAKMYGMTTEYEDKLQAYYDDMDLKSQQILTRLLFMKNPLRPEFDKFDSNELVYIIELSKKAPEGLKSFEKIIKLKRNGKSLITHTSDLREFFEATVKQPELLNKFIELSKLKKEDKYVFDKNLANFAMIFTSNPQREELFNTMIDSGMDIRKAKSKLKMFGSKTNHISNENCKILLETNFTNGDDDIVEVVQGIKKEVDTQLLKYLCKMNDNSDCMESYNIIAVVNGIADGTIQESDFKKLTSKNKNGEYKYTEAGIRSALYDFRRNKKSLENSLSDLKEADKYEDKIKKEFSTEAEFGTNNDCARLAYEAFLDLKAKGFKKFPRSIKRASEIYMRDAAGRCGFEDEDIVLSDYNEYVFDGIKSISMPELPKELIGNEEHLKKVVYHEVAHIYNKYKLGENNYLTFRTSTPQEFKELKQKISNEVSEYATKNPLEFVAEVFAGIMSGAKFDEKLMNLYYQYGGIEVPE